MLTDIKTFNCADAAIGQRFLSWPGRSIGLIGTRVKRALVCDWFSTKLKFAMP
jgi:hypothetical protein